MTRTPNRKASTESRPVLAVEGARSVTAVGWIAGHRQHSDL